MLIVSAWTIGADGVEEKEMLFTAQRRDGMRKGGGGQWSAGDDGWRIWEFPSLLRERSRYWDGFQSVP